MAAAHESVLYDVHDFKVYPLLSDSTAASPTYGAAVDIPGIAEASMEPNLVTAELKGDARVIAKRGRTDRFKCSAKYGKLALDALVVILGGAVADTANSAKYSLTSPAPLPYFKTAFKIDDVDVGLATCHVILYKCQLTGGTLITQSTDNFGQPTFDLEAIQPDYTSTPMGDTIFYTGATALPA